MTNTASTDAELTTAMADLADSVDRLVAAQEIQTTAVLRARLNGASWSVIADALGVTKQAAQQRYGRV